VVRRVTDVPVAGHPLRLRGTGSRYRCTTTECSWEVFADNIDRLARPGWSTTRRCTRYVLRRLMIDRMTVSAVARELGLSWDTVNAIAIDATQTIAAADTHRLDGVRVIGVDEHRGSYTRRGDGFVTVTQGHWIEATDGTRSSCCFWVSSSVLMTAWVRAAKSCTRDRS
jgi:hypothetical protein